MGHDIIHHIGDYFRSKPEIAAVYLFGSFARGGHRPFSDLDLGLVFERCTRNVAAQKMAGYFIELSKLTHKDPHLVSMNYANELLLKQIFAKGRCILVNDPKTLSKFRTEAYAKIADFGFHKKRIEKCFTQKLMQG